MEKYVKLSDIMTVLDKSYEEPGYWHTGETFFAGICEAKSVISDLPTIEIEEPEVGSWMPTSKKPEVHAGMKCSLCKARISYKDYYGGQHNYCYKCGAKMNKEDEV